MKTTKTTARKPTTNTKSTKQKNNQSLKKIRTCGLCGMTFTNYTRLLYHCKRHNNEREFKCKLETCGKEFITKSELQKHERVHQKFVSHKKVHSETEQIPRIDEGIPNIPEQDLSPNDISIPDDNDNASPETLAEFVTKDESISNEESHQNGEVNVSTSTGKQKSINGSVYTGVKPFRCDICSKSFIHVNQLQGHKESHVLDVNDNFIKINQEGESKAKSKPPVKLKTPTSGEKQKFQCQVCQVSFVNRRLFQKHIPIHLKKM